MSTPDTADDPRLDPNLRRGAAIHEADRLLLRHGLPSYSRVCADRTLHAVDWHGEAMKRGLHLLRTDLLMQNRALRFALLNMIDEATGALAQIDQGFWESGLDQITCAMATLRKAIGPQPERLQPGVIDFIAHFEARIARDLVEERL